MGKTKESAAQVRKLAKFLCEAVEGLKQADDDGRGATCYRYVLDENLAVFVGWVDGYADDDNSVIHAKNKPSWAINAGVKLREDDYWCDYDWLSFPTDENGEPCDMGAPISPKENYEHLAAYLLGQYDAYTSRNQREGL